MYKIDTVHLVGIKVVSDVMKKAWNKKKKL